MKWHYDLLHHKLYKAGMNFISIDVDVSVKDLIIRLLISGLDYNLINI